jgi:hypothetical protein
MRIPPRPVTPQSEAGRVPRGDRFLRGLVVLSTIAAFAIVCVNIRRFIRDHHIPLRAAAPAEERIDSITAGRLAAMRGGSSARTHRLVGILDPHGSESSEFARALSRLASDDSLNVSVSLYFAPQYGGRDTSAVSDILAALCARRQERLVAFLEVLNRDKALRRRALDALARAAHIEDVGAFMACVRRRETIEEVADGQVLMNSLRLTQLPAVVLDSTVIRRRISVDSIGARLRAGR